MREIRDPQNGCQIGPVPLYGYYFCKTPSIRVQLGLKQLGIVFFSNYSNPLRLRVKRTINCISIVTQHSQIVFLINCIMIYKYIPLISFCSVNIYQGDVPQYGVSLPCGPIHMGKLSYF